MPRPSSITFYDILEEEERRESGLEATNMATATSEQVVGTSSGNNDIYPTVTQPLEAQVLTLSINKKEAKITPLNYKKFKITYKNENYLLNLGPLVKITSELVLSLTQHAVRLKKNITFVQYTENIIRLEANKKEIVILVFGTERYLGKTTRVRHLEFPMHKVKLEEIETLTNRRMRISAIPEDKEKVGYKFEDLKGNPIAYMSNNYGAIFLLWNGFRYDGTPMKSLISYIDYILINYSAKCDTIKAKAIERLEQEREKQRKLQYTQFIEKMFKDSIYALENRMHTTQNDMDAHMRGLLTKGKEFDRDGTFLQTLKNRSTSKEIKDRLETDYTLISKLRKTNKYTDFRFDSGSIVGTTSMIKFFDKYEIGIFDVYLSLNGVAKCYNKTYKLENLYDHPHVENGNPCWGNLGDTLFKILRSHQFGAAFDMMYEFLMRYNDGLGSGATNRPYRRLETFNPVFLTQGLVKCEHCGRIKELCQCGHNADGQVLEGNCSQCNRPYSRCECNRCPAEPLPNNLIGVDIDCNSDCDHWNEEEECCGF